MPSLVIAEHKDGHLLPLTRHVVTAGAQIHHDIHILVIGDGIDNVAREACIIDGVSAVYTADDAAFSYLAAEDVERQVLLFLNKSEVSYQAILFSASTFGKNCAPRIAAKLNIFQLSDITAVIDARTFERPIYAGNAVATLQSDEDVNVITVRTTAFSPAADGEPAPVSAVQTCEGSDLSLFIGQEMTVSTRPELQSARVVVSGGRALGSERAFSRVVDSLADKLGAAVGASRAAVDAGYAPNDHQIGQTGKIVAPELYIALGISGAIQHVAGMKASGVVVAINRDPDAPIFSVADYGLVADIFEAVPELISKL